MFKNVKLIIENRFSDQRGYAIIIALLILIAAILFVSPFLSFMSTGYKTTKDTFEVKNKEQYAADAGVARAMWTIKYNNTVLPQNQGDSYNITDMANVNAKPVVVTITYLNKVDDTVTYRIVSTAGSVAVQADIAYTQGVQESQAKSLFSDAVTGVAGDITMSGAAVIRSDGAGGAEVDSAGNVTLSGSAYITGDVYADNNVSLGTSTRINGNASAHNTVSTGGTVTGTRTSGAALEDLSLLPNNNLNDTVQTVYNSTFNISTITPGGTTYNSGLTISDQTGTHYPKINVIGNLTLKNSSVTFDSEVYVTGNIFFQSGTQNITFSGPVYAGGQVYTDKGGGTVTFGSSLTTGSMNLGSSYNFFFNGALKDLGNLTVGNSTGTHFGSTIYVGGNFIYSGASNLTIQDDMYIKGNLTLGNSAQIVGPEKVVARGNVSISGAGSLEGVDQLPFIIVPPGSTTPALSPPTDPATFQVTNGGTVSALIYAPTAAYSSSGSASLYGAAICNSFTLDHSAQIIYPETLANPGVRPDLPTIGSQGGPTGPPIISLNSWGIH